MSWIPVSHSRHFSLVRLLYFTTYWLLISLFLFFLFQHKVPLLSLEALHHLHIFIFVLAIVHVTFSLLTIVFGGAKVSTLLTCSSFLLFNFVCCLNWVFVIYWWFRYVNGSTVRTVLQKLIMRLHKVCMIDYLWGLLSNSLIHIAKKTDIIWFIFSIRSLILHDNWSRLTLF